MDCTANLFPIHLQLELHIICHRKESTKMDTTLSPIFGHLAACFMRLVKCLRRAWNLSCDSNSVYIRYLTSWLNFLDGGSAISVLWWQNEPVFSVQENRTMWLSSTTVRTLFWWRKFIFYYNQKYMVIFLQIWYCQVIIIFSLSIPRAFTICILFPFS